MHCFISSVAKLIFGKPRQSTNHLLSTHYSFALRLDGSTLPYLLQLVVPCHRKAYCPLVLVASMTRFVEFNKFQTWKNLSPKGNTVNLAVPIQGKKKKLRG